MVTLEIVQQYRWRIPERRQIGWLEEDRFLFRRAEASMLKLMTKHVLQTTSSIRLVIERWVASVGCAAKVNAIAGVIKLSPITVRSRVHLNSKKSKAPITMPMAW